MRNRTIRSAFVGSDSSESNRSNLSIVIGIGTIGDTTYGRMNIFTYIIPYTRLAADQSTTHLTSVRSSRRRGVSPSDESTTIYLHFYQQTDRLSILRAPGSFRAAGWKRHEGGPEQTPDRDEGNDPRYPVRWLAHPHCETAKVPSGRSPSSSLPVESRTR